MGRRASFPAPAGGTIGACGPRSSPIRPRWQGSRPWKRHSMHSVRRRSRRSWAFVRAVLGLRNRRTRRWVPTRRRQRPRRPCEGSGRSACPSSRDRSASCRARLRWSRVHRAPCARGPIAPGSLPCSASASLLLAWDFRPSVGVGSAGAAGSPAMCPAAAVWACCSMQSAHQNIAPVRNPTFRVVSPHRPGAVRPGTAWSKKATKRCEL